MDQRLWVFEVFREVWVRWALARANEELTNCPKVEEEGRKMEEGRKREEAARKKEGPACGQQATASCRPAAARSLTQTMARPLFPIFFGLKKIKLGCLGIGLAFGRMGVRYSYFLNLAPILGRVKSSIPHGAWRFHFFFKLFLC
jgi:hypothetical protein